jgi:hypothetical protein
LVKLALPSLTEVARITLGADATYGTYSAESVAVSPADPNVVAVSLASSRSSPRHRGVALINGTSILPTMTQPHTGSNVVTFGADGSAVYGLNNESSEFGLRRIDVAADGLRQGTVVTSGGGYGTYNLRFAGGQLYLLNQSWRASDLTLSGTFDRRSPLCAPLSDNQRVVCAPNLDARQTLTVWSATAFTQQATVPLPGLGIDQVTNLVPGPAGTVAVAMSDFNGNTRMVLISNPSL